MENKSITTDQLEASFDAMTKNLSKPGDEILTTLTPEKCEIAHMAVGVAGEAGELLDAVKKFIFYNKSLDLENIIEEMGDVEFFMSRLRQLLGLTREQILKANMKKLLTGDNARYAEGKYSDEQAHTRADKQ